LDDVFGSASNGACLIDIFNPYQPTAMVHARIEIASECRDE
jgi:hypothetical protein